MDQTLRYVLLILLVIALPFLRRYIVEKIAGAVGMGKVKIEDVKNKEFPDMYTKVSPQDAKALMDEGGYIILDVRTAGEFAGGHIKGAINHPVEDIANISRSIADKDAKILLYCRSGGRSKMAAYAMIQQGYRNVIDFGGLLDWPYATVR